MPKSINIYCSTSKICQLSRIYNAGGQKTLNLSLPNGVTLLGRQSDKENLMRTNIQTKIQSKMLVSFLCAAIWCATMSTSLAAGAGNSLEDCYNNVTTACEQAARPAPCSNFGKDACNKEHSTSNNTNDINKMRAPKTKKKRSPMFILQSMR